MDMDKTSGHSRRVSCSPRVASRMTGSSEAKAGWNPAVGTSCPGCRIQRCQFELDS